MSHSQFSVFIASRLSQPYVHRGMAGFLSFVSLLGLVLAVFSLIVVMSVMNGFERELQERMLSLISPAQLPLAKSSGAGDEATLQGLQQQLQRHGEISGVAPYLEDTVVLARDDQLLSASLLAIDAERESSVSSLPEHIIAGDISRLQARHYGIVIGRGLADRLDLFIGDSIDLTIAKVYMSPFGPLTRQKRFEVVAIFEVGSELDHSVVMLQLDDARRLLGRTQAYDGLRLAMDNPYRSREVVAEALSMLDSQQRELLRSDWIDWRDKNRALYNAVVMEKVMVFVLLMAVVAVATFNIISIILMTAANKRSEIAVLKTIGASRRQIRDIFLLQGTLIGFSGTAIGVIAGTIVAPRVGSLLKWVENATGWVLFDPGVYYIPYLPSELHWIDVATVATLALFLSVIVTLLPALRAAGIPPILSLRETV